MHDGDSKKKKLEHGTLDKEMLEFYQALGTFNTNIIARLIQNPELVEKLTKTLVNFCLETEEPCNEGYVWDHRKQQCVRLAIYTTESAPIET